jgi:hypothetical protein
VFVLAAATLAILGCADELRPISLTRSDARQSPDASEALENAGTLSMDMVLPNGATLSAVDWSISGPGGYSLTSKSPGQMAVPVGSVGAIRFVVGGIPAGSGYAITLSGTDSFGNWCGGTSGAFSIFAGGISTATVGLVCTVLSDAAPDVGGSVLVEAGLSYVDVCCDGTCLGSYSITASPVETVVGGQPVTLNVSTTGAATFQWTENSDAGSAHLSSATAATTTLTCDAPGSIDVGVTVWFAGTSACANQPAATLSAVVECDAPLPDAGPDSGPDAADSASPVDASQDATTSADASTSTDASDSGAVRSDANLPVPCTSVGQTDCVPCDGNTAGVCTAMQALIVQRDISKGNFSGLSLSTASCYECLWQWGCIDNDVFADTNADCKDVSGSNVQACLSTTSCVLSSGCEGNLPDGAPPIGVDNCSCGPSSSGEGMALKVFACAESSNCVRCWR